ncbi:MAG: two-component system cell cycle response regulator, partial [Myxococcota bacterium]
MSQLLDQLRDANSIPSPPGVALEIIRLNQRDDVDLDDLEAILIRDPAIVAKLLRIANSSSFGRPGQVSDVRQAVMTLGLRSLNLLALSFSLASYSETDPKSRFDYGRYWTSSAVATSAATVLARKYVMHFIDETFLASILCDFGQLILTEGATDKYKPVIKRMAKSNQSLQEIEREILGGDHAEIGGELLAEWGLPPLICGAIQYHHNPDDERNTDHDTRAIARVLHIASLVGDVFFAGSEIDAGISALQEAAQAHFSMDPSDCQELLEATEESMAEIIDMLGITCTDPAEIAEIRVRATNYLVTQSMALNQQIEAVSADSEQLKKRNSDLEQRATTDALTGLRNRGHFDEWLESESVRAAQAGHALGVLFLDIDHFKSVNDTHGHQCGDELLKAIATAIKECARGDNIVCRYGGEEIAVISPEHDLRQLKALAEKLRVAVGRTS